MILRRMMQNIKTQNWFAVVVEFVIVVFGVFVGLQVQEWNNQRQFQNQEIAFLKEMQKEIETNTVVSTHRAEYMQQIIASGERAIEFIKGNESCKENCWALLVDFFAASQVLFTPSSSSVYEEMKLLGLPQSKDLKKTVSRYYLLNETMTMAVDRSSKYRILFREAMPVHVHKALWNNCHRIKDFSEELIPDCPQEIANDELILLLDNLRNHPDIIRYLNYWIGMHTLWTPIFLDQVAGGEELIEAIDQELSQRMN